MQDNVAQDPLVEVLDYAFGEIDGGKPDADDASVLRVAFEHFGYRLAPTAQPEVKALVEALEFYATWHPHPNDGPWGVDSTDFGKRAQQALAAHRESQL